jgi:SAM-dependent methyltransferase
MSCGGHPWVAAVLDVAMAPRQAQRTKVVPFAQGRTLEIGAGTGLNLALYPPDVDLVVVEPDPFMARRLVRRAQALGRPVVLHEEGAESLPFASGSFDTVVATWVFCTIPDPVASPNRDRSVLDSCSRRLPPHPRSYRAVSGRRICRRRGAQPARDIESGSEFPRSGAYYSVSFINVRYAPAGSAITDIRP